MHRTRDNSRRMGHILRRKRFPARPRVPRAGEKAIDERHQQRAARERPEQAVGAEQAELHGHAPAATSAANSRRPARESGVVFGSEIMKNANSSSARRSGGGGWERRGALPASASGRPPGRRSEAGTPASHRRARRARDDEEAEPRHQEREPRRLPHWPGDTYTASAEQQHHGEADVGRVEDVLAADANEELAADPQRTWPRLPQAGDRWRSRAGRWRTAADKGAARIKRRQPPAPRSRRTVWPGTCPIASRHELA